MRHLSFGPLTFATASNPQSFLEVSALSHWQPKGLFFLKVSLCSMSLRELCLTRDMPAAARQISGGNRGQQQASGKSCLQ